MEWIESLVRHIHSKVAVGVAALREWSVKKEAEPANEHVLKREELLQRRGERRECARRQTLRDRSWGGGGRRDEVQWERRRRGRAACQRLWHRRVRSRPLLRRDCGSTRCVAAGSTRSHRPENHRLLHQIDWGPAAVVITRHWQRYADDSQFVCICNDDNYLLLFKCKILNRILKFGSKRERVSSKSGKSE